MYTQLWHAVCLVWQQCITVQKVIDALCGGAKDALTIEMQSSFVSLIEATEQAVGANISVSYKFKLFSRLCKTIEREGAPLADSLVERLAQTLVQPDVKQAYSSLCFFYGTQLQGPAAPEGDHQGSSLSGTAPCCVEELVEKWHQYRTHTKTSVPATHFSGWVVLKASSDMLAGGTGCHVWQSGLYLSQWILNNRSLVEGKRCLELGSGAGLVGVSLMRSGASQVLLTDGNQEAVSNCQHNIELSQESASISIGENCERSCDSLGPPPEKCEYVSVEVLQWGSRRVEADLIVASDVIYDESGLASLVEQLRMQLRDSQCSYDEHENVVYMGYGTLVADNRVAPAMAIVASAIRNIETLESFVKQCEAVGLVVRQMECVFLGQENAEESGNMQVQWQHCQAFEGGEELILHHIS